MVYDGEGREGAALELLPRGRDSPWIPVFFKGVKGVGAKSVQTCYSLRGRSPAYPFFRKEKIQLHRRRRDYDAESFERVLLRSGLSAG